MTKRLTLGLLIVGAVILGAKSAEAFDVPHPTVSVPRPTISVPRPTISVPRPTISVPHPTASVTKPTISVTKPSAPTNNATVTLKDTNQKISITPGSQAKGTTQPQKAADTNAKVDSKTTADTKTNPVVKAADDSGGDGGGTGGSGLSGPITKTETLPNGQTGTVTVYPNGNVTMSNGNGSVTLTPAQQQQLLAGDTSLLAPLMGSAASGTRNPLNTPATPLNLPNLPPPPPPDINVTGTANQNFNNPGLGQTTDNASLKATGDGLSGNASYSQTQNSDDNTTKSVVGAGVQVNDTDGDSAGFQYKQTDSNPSPGQSTQQTQLSGSVGNGSGSITVTSTDTTQQTNGKQTTSSGLGVTVSDSSGQSNGGDSASVEVTNGDQGKTESQTVTGDVKVDGVGDVKVTDQSTDTPGSTKEVGKGDNAHPVTTADKTTDTTSLQVTADVAPGTTITYSQSNGTSPSQAVDLNTKVGSTTLDLGANKNSTGAVTGNATVNFPALGGQVGVNAKNIGGGSGANGAQVGVQIQIPF
jgi:hypothetical protein